MARDRGGQEIIGEHDELGPGAGGHEELYLVLSGRATFTLDGETVPAPAGSLVFVKDPATKRRAVADEAATEILVVGGRPGATFAVSPWERSAEALRLLDDRRVGPRDRHPAGAARPRSAQREPLLQPRLRREPRRLRSTPPSTTCARDRAGAELRELAGDDADLDPIRGDPRFPVQDL